MSVSLRHHVGLVVVGRNEAPRLERSLPGLASQVGQVVYVDSGSTDGSIDIARSNGALIVELDRSAGFTAARARNAGFKALLAATPDLRYVQFFDGDCLLAEGWLETAAKFLEKNTGFAAVCGRRQEERPARNHFHLVTDMEWDTPIGAADYFGGDVMIRVDALSGVGGYRDTLIAGEEPELCIRLRRAGWRLQRLDHPMTFHDIQMDSWRQWWRRNVRAGHAFAEGAALHGSGCERHWIRERRSLVLWGLVLPAVALMLAWPTGGLSLVAAALALVLLFVKATRAMMRRGNRLADAALYAAHCVISKFPQGVGAIRYWTRRKSATRLIEYRTQPACST